MDVGSWLRSLGLGQYEAAFQENAIDATVLPALTAEDLKELGVAALGHRKRLLGAIAALDRAPGQPPPVRVAPDEPYHDRPHSPPEPAQPPAARPREPERRRLTVMFADLVGSTALSTRLDPEEMHGLLRAFQGAVAAEIVRCEGYVAKLMGDGVLAYFGWPRAHEDEPDRAARAGLAVVEAVRRLPAPADGAPLAARVGIATGLVVVGDLQGEGAAQEEAVAGETPNLAARLQQAAEPGTVLVAEATRELLEGRFELDGPATPDMKGLPGELRAYRLRGEARQPGAGRSPRGRSGVRIIGRERELSLLLGRWELAKGGEGQVVVLVGEAGIGKSAIAEGLREQLRPEGPTVLRYYGSPHHTGTALQPVVEQLEHAAGLLPGEDQSARLDKIEVLVGEAGQEPRAVAPVFARLLGIPGDGRCPPLDLTPPVLRARTLELLLDQLAGIARRSPVLVLLEDTQWFDPTTCELFGSVVERVQDLPVLLVASARPEFQADWPGHAHATLISLNRLGARHVEEIAGVVCAGRRLPREVLDQIVARADGVPLFAEELTRAVLASGVLREAAGRLVLDGPLPPMAVPATLHDSLMARLDRLNPTRELAQVAACIGRTFDEDLLAVVSGLTRGEIGAGLARLVGAGIVHVRGAARGGGGGRVYVFRHGLVQELARENLLRTRRRELHRRIAEAIEATRPAAVADEPEVLARHYAEAGLPGRAARFRLAAGRLAAARHAVREATTHLEACVSLAEGTSPAEATALRTVRRDAWLALGDLAGLGDDLEDANENYRRALALAEGGDERRMVRDRLHRPGEVMRDGARIAFYEHGTGAPTIVFVNPIVYGLATFQPLLERLCYEFRVITVDCRGSGRSDPLVRPFGTADHTEDLRAVIEAAGAAPIVGVGISRGSNQLIHLAHRHPELVGALMTVGLPIRGTGPGEPGFFEPEYLRRRAEAYAQEDLEALAQLQMEFVYPEEHAGELRRMAVETCLRMPRESLLSFYDPDPSMDVVPLLGSIAVPTLVAHGKADRLLRYQAAEFLAARIPGARLHLFEEKGHNPMFSAPDEFCEVLRRFIRTCEMGRVRAPGRQSAREALKPTARRRTPRFSPDR